MIMMMRKMICDNDDGGGDETNNDKIIKIMISTKTAIVDEPHNGQNLK